MLVELDRLGLSENTLIILSSDNGPVLDDGYKDQSVELLGGHTPSGTLRGGKGSLFEGGTRVPFFVRWKGKVEPRISDALICQIDILASLAEMLGQKLDEPKDSENLMDALLGKSDLGRNSLVIEGVNNLAYRSVNWVMIPPSSGEDIQKTTGTETARSKVYQLYNLSDDIGQQVNLTEKEPTRLDKMKTELELESGREYR
jgi:arylsulfatase A-like enzyme